MALAESLQRFHECVLSWDSYERKLMDSEKLADRRVIEVTESWLTPAFARSLDETFAATVFKPPASNEVDIRVTPAPMAEIKDRFYIDLLRECIQAVPYVQPKEIIGNIADSSLFFGQMLLHCDEELARETSLALQQLMIGSPNYRSLVIQGMVSLVMKFDDSDTASLQTLLSHLVLLIDLWNYLMNKEDSANWQASPNSTRGPDLSSIREVLFFFSIFLSVHSFVHSFIGWLVGLVG